MVIERRLQKKKEIKQHNRNQPDIIRTQHRDTYGEIVYEEIEEKGNICDDNDNLRDCDNAIDYDQCNDDDLNDDVNYTFVYGDDVTSLVYVEVDDQMVSLCVCWYSWFRG